MWNTTLGIVGALAPTVLVGLIFWYILAAVIRADRTERTVYSKIEAEERERFEAEREASTKKA